MHSSVVRLIAPRRILTLVAILLLLPLFLHFSSSAYAATYVSGPITEDTIWNLDGSPYVLTNNEDYSAVYVLESVRLTIEPGVIVKMEKTANGSTFLAILGILEADGATFTSSLDDVGGDTNGDGSATLPAAGDWFAVYFANGSSGSLSNTVIRYGGSTMSNVPEYGQVISDNASLNISSSQIYESANSGIATFDTTPMLSIYGTVMSDNGGAGLHGPAHVTGSTFAGNAFGGMYSSVPITTLNSNQFSDNNGTAVTIPATIGSAVMNNSYAGNLINGMSLTGQVTENTRWPSSNLPYVLVEEIYVTENANLTIDPDTVIKPKDVFSGIHIAGELIANGVTFTSFLDDGFGGDTNGDGASTSPSPGDWSALRFSEGVGSLVHSLIRHGGVSSDASALTVHDSTIEYSSCHGLLIHSGAGAPSGSVSISDTEFRNNGCNGLRSSDPISYLVSNSFVDNSGPGVQITGFTQGAIISENTFSGNSINEYYLSGVIDENQNWPGSERAYVVGPITVGAGSTLTISPGTVLKPTSSIEVLGTLIANGVVFTSINDDTHGGKTNGESHPDPEPGDWGRIHFVSGSSGFINDSTILSGGSDSIYNSMIRIDTAGMLSIANSIIQHSKADGIHVTYNATGTSITNSAVAYNRGQGVTAWSSTVYIHNNDIFANAHGLDSGNIDVSNNWWGGTGGPKPSGTGNEVSGATFVPWSDVPFTLTGAVAMAMGTDTWCGAFGEPVNTSTGAFYYSHTDISIPTRGLPLEFARTYNSNDINDGPLGVGWSFAWQISANTRQNGDVVILRGDGRRDTFILNPDGSYTAPAGRHDTLEKNPAGTYKLFTSEQVTYNFGANNRLASAVSETGQVTAYSYNDNHRLATITEPAGRTLTFTYTPENRIDEITDPQDNTVSFIYSPEGNLTQVTDQNGGITLFGYDGYHHMISITDANSHAFVNNVYDASGRVAEQRDAEGNLLTFTYDPANRRSTMTRIMDPNDPAKNQVTVHEYDTAMRLTREIDPLGEETIYTYDAAGNRDSVTDHRGVTTRSIFDSHGNITDLYKAYGLPEQQHTSVTYNAKNHPLTKTDARGYTSGYAYEASGTFLQQISYPQVSNYDGTYSAFTESFTYNPDGTIATITDKNGDTSAFTYDSYGGMDTITQNTNRPAADQVTLGYDFDSLGRKTRFVDGNGHETTYQYSPIGDLRYVRTTVTNPETQLPEDIVTEYQYDGNGNKTAAIDPAGKPTSYAYTAMDNLRLVTDARLNTIEHTYDAAYSRTATKDKNGNWTDFGYDKNNRLVSITDPEDNTTAFVLDEEGNRTSATDPLGRTVTSTYDGLGRLISVTEPDEGGAQRTTSYTYDAADNLISTTDPANHTFTSSYDELGRQKVSTDALANSVYSKYDGAGNRIKSKDQRGYEMTFAFSPNDWLKTVSDPLSNVTAYDYDARGNMRLQTDSEGHMTHYVYDELGRLVEEKVHAGGNSYLLEKDFVYDKAGNLIKAINGDGTIAYAYDGVYNLMSVSDRQAGIYSFTYDNNGNQLTAETAGKTLSFSYNARNLLSSATDARSVSETFTYDAAGNLVQRDDSVGGQNLTTTYSHTPRNQVKQVNGPSGTSAFSYDASGHLASKSYPNGISTSLGYDAAGQLSTQTSQNGTQTIQTYSQIYDPAGNITSVTEAGLGTINYTYDPLNRLITENIPAFGAIMYSYDSVGNRTAISAPTYYGYYEFNQANQLIYGLENEEERFFTYDASGNLTSKSSPGWASTYLYNGMGRLKEANVAGQSPVSYTYDALGRRDSRSYSGSSLNYHYLAKTDLIDYKTDSGGNLNTGVVRGPDGMMTFTAYTPGGPITGYEHFNPHGDNVLITDDEGNAMVSSRYDAFGNIIGSNSNLNYEYTGKWQRENDHVTGFVGMGVRDYDSTLGRFTAMDPLQGTSLDPQQRNRYTYTSNNPLTRYDLNGLYWGESFVNATVGTTTDFVEGGLDAVQGGGTPMDFLAGGAGASAENWSNGYSTMSTNEQIALWALPVAPIVAAAGVEAAGVGGTVLAFDALATGTGGLLTRLGIKCADKGSKSASIKISARQLQRKFTHAGDFGITGNYSKANAESFGVSINQHLNSPTVQTINGTYRGQPVIHHLDPNTGLNVITDQSGNFISGWRLGAEQLLNVLNHGGLN